MFSIPSPDLQVSFSVALAEIREQCLQQALLRTVGQLDINELDTALSHVVSSQSRQTMARQGLRAELMFPCPLVLRANPYLLGYYRLLYGYSQKQFYTAATGAAPMKSMEENGRLTNANDAKLDDFCAHMAAAGDELLNGIGAARLSQTLLEDLTLITLGPQLRGGANVKKGARGIVKVFDAIYGIVAHSVISVTPSQIVVQNAAGRRVLIEFAPDPDIIIREEVAPDIYNKKIAIEVKAGADSSNIHNRIGEAEKSHQKAKKDGYVECWTVVNVDNVDPGTAQVQSPSTNKFYRLSHLEAANSTEYSDFRHRVIALAGVTNPP